MSSGQLRRFRLLARIARVLLPEYRFKWPQMAWWQDAAFTGYLRRFGAERGFNTDRRWMLAQLLRLAEPVPGDTAECGVYIGESSWLILAANARSSGTKWHFGFDSFEGLSHPSSRDGSHWTKGDLTAAEQVARDNLRPFERVTLLGGWIPARFDEVAERRFSFVHIDVDLHQPTRDSMEFFYGRMNPGGVILCDDYGFTSCPGATAAVDEFLADKPEKMMALSCGGGFMIRGTAVAPPLVLPA